jgi:hypothetical protein
MRAEGCLMPHPVFDRWCVCCWIEWCLRSLLTEASEK